MNEKAIFSAVGEILKAELKKIDDRVEKLVQAQTEKTIGVVVEKLLSDEVIEKLQSKLPKTPGIDGIGIKAVEQEESSAFSLVLDNDQTIQVKLPEPLKGEAGEKGLQGSDGLDGLDSPIAEARLACAGLEKNDLAYYAGGLFQATKKTIGTPEDDAGAYRLVVNGVDKAEFNVDPIERKAAFVIRKTDGDQQEIFVDMPAGYVADPKVVSRLFKGDYTFEGTKIKIWDGEAWQEHQQRGPTGREGKTGAGIKGAKLSDNQLRFETTTGKTFDVPFVETVAEYLLSEYGETIAKLAAPAQENTTQIINRFAGIWKAGESNKAGDVVTTSHGLFLALADTKEAPEKSNDWQLMLASQLIQTSINS